MKKVMVGFMVVLMGLLLLAPMAKEVVWVVWTGNRDL